MKKAIEEILEFVDERDWDKFHTPENLAKSISIEAAELLECFQWEKQGDKNEISEELADILTYCLILAHKYDLDLETIILEKLEKNRSKYPVDKAKGRSTKYNKL